MSENKSPDALVNVLGWYSDTIECRVSPYFDERPANVEVNTLVVNHLSTIAGTFSQPFVEQLFMGNLASESSKQLKQLIGLRVSSHFFIQQDGYIVQYVPLHMRAWFAKQTMTDSSINPHDFSIGIELENIGRPFYRKEQYQSLIALTQRIMSDFPEITADHIVGFHEITSQSNATIQDNFDWTYFFEQLKKVKN
ncbi:MAG: N-acetylmuramoyl-L-alanine amidase [Shewanellaceae bacterium]|nr:N-acetylmuramoyl-L-alanine amidase [Shewanellaceae bacterium]